MPYFYALISVISAALYVRCGGVFFFVATFCLAWMGIDVARIVALRWRERAAIHAAYWLSLVASVLA